MTRSQPSDAVSAERLPDFEWDAFVSYAHVDRDRVLEIADGLEALGWSLWVDRDDLTAGSRLTEELPIGMRDAHTLIFMMTEASVASRWCLGEIDDAIALGRRIIPVELDPTAAAPPRLDDYLRFTPPASRRPSRHHPAAV